jgi:hypothetical protein
VPEDAPERGPAAKPKRRYTVTVKVLAANRGNLEKANAVPREIRYRPTPKRVAACRFTFGSQPKGNAIRL